MARLNLDITKVVNYMIIIYATVLPLGHAMANIVMGIMSIFFLIMSLMKNVTQLKGRWVFLFSSYFVVSLLSLIYSENIEYGLVSLVKKISIVAFPLFLFSFKDRIELKYVKSAFLWYTFSIILVCFASLMAALYNCLESNCELTINCISDQNLASSFISYHKLYLSLYITIGIFLTNYLLFNTFKGRRKMYFIFFTNLILVITLILLRSRTPLVVSFILLVIIPQFQWIRSKKYSYVFYSVITLLLITSINIKFNPLLIDKVKESINYNDEYNIKKKWGGASVRKLIWEYSYYVVKENPVFGTGIGDAQDELNLSYKKCIESSALKQSVYNSHNDLLQLMVSTGVFGFTVFLVCYTYIFVISFRNSNYWHCGFIMLFFLCGLTESYLERDMGVRIFAFLSPLLFIITYLDENTTNT